MAKSRITLVHWKQEEGEKRIADLRRAGFDATMVRPQGGNLSLIRQNPPDILVIDLTRLPSYGREVGAVLRGSRSMRYVPIVFAGGLPEKVEVVRSVLPDALFSSWEEIVPVLKTAKNAVPARPVTPGTGAIYKNTPVSKKLGIVADSTLTVVGAPDEYPECLDLPDGVTVYRQAGQPSERVLLFVERLSQLEHRFLSAERSVIGGGFWIIWPKRSSGVPSDLTEDIVRQYALDRDWVDYKVCAVDKTWSGLLFTRKKK